jgi:chitinase
MDVCSRAIRRHESISALWKLLVGIAVSAGATCAADDPSASPVPRDEFRIAGYLPDYRGDGFPRESLESLTDLILFSAEPTADGSLDLSCLDSFPLAELKRRTMRGRVRLWLAIGGWERSQHFATVALDADKRREFVSACVETCLRERFDGIDLDWEHPHAAEEEQAYAVLIADLRDAFEPHGLGLSLTMAAWQQVPPEAFAAVDWVQVMSYDHPGAHSTLEQAQADVDRLLAAGVPSEKLVLGLPLYGRDRTRPERTLTYAEITARAPEAAESDEWDGVSFNGPETIRRKVAFAQEAGLAGVMVWEIGQDAAGERSLLRVINESAAEN